MAGRVNMRFVMSLSAGLLVAFGAVAGSAYYLLVNSASDLAKAGDKAEASGDLSKAIELYSKSVNKEQTNTINLEKWRSALRKATPESEVVYRDYFGNQYMAATRQLARVQKDNVEVQREHLGYMREMTLGEFRRGDQDRYISECDVIIGLHTGAPKGGPADVLKRFRGMAKAELYAFVPDAKIETAKEAEADLIDALAADPTDGESLVTLQQLYGEMAQRAQQHSNVPEAEALRAKAEQVITDGAAKAPKDAYIQLLLVARDMGKAQREYVLQSQKTKLNVADVLGKLSADFKPRLDAVMALVREADGARITPRLVNQIRMIEAFVDSGAKNARAEEACSLALAKRPTDAQLLAQHADLAAARDEYVLANERLQKIIDLPMPPTSIEGMKLIPLKPNAVYLQALYSAKSFLAASEADRPKLLAQTKALREKLVASVAKDQPPVLFIDAQIAFCDADYSRANRLIDQYMKAMRERATPDALLLAAQVAERINQLGLSKDYLEKLNKAAPGRPASMLLLADVEMRLQNFSKAEDLYSQLLTVLPDNDTVKTRLAQAQIAQGKASLPGATTDPVLVDMQTAQQMTNPLPGKQARPEELIPFLEKIVEKHNYDWRVVVSLGNAYMREGSKEKATALLNKAIEKHPESKELAEYKIAATTADPLESKIKIINSKDIAPVQKALGLHMVYKQAGKTAEAKEQLAAAAKLAPNDNAVVEFQFLDALDEDRMDEAQRLVDVAIKGNMDEADGLTFRSRFLASQAVKSKDEKTAKKLYNDAIAAMDAAVAKGGAIPETWRMKGRMERMLGRKAESVESFRQAIKLRPSDAGSINDLIIALEDLSRDEEALAFARESERFASDDDTFISLWLNLEAAVGNKTVALERREVMAKNSPNDRANLVKLASLYLSERDWAKARPIIDRATKLSPGFDVLTLDAIWNWEQGDKEKARKLFDDYIAAMDKSKATSAPYLSYAQFLATHDDMNGALAILDKARAFQDPKIAEADRSIADVYARVQNFEQAADVCRRIINAGADTTDHIYRKRLVESLIQLKNFEAAQKEVDEMVKGDEPDMITMLLMADLKASMKDSKGQLEILDRAVARFPGEATVFLQRGKALLTVPKRERDAISDFNKALTMSADMWQAYRLRAAANIAINQIEEAVKDLRSALKIAPRNDDLLYGLVADLMRMGRTADAVDISTQAISQRKRDVPAMLQIALIMADSGAHAEACRFYKQAFEIDNSDQITQRYLDSLLAQNPPDTTEANRVMTVLGVQRISRSPGFLMALAKIKMKENQLAQANAAARDALKLLDAKNPMIMLAWFNDLKKLIPKRTDVLNYLNETAKMAAASQSLEWIDYFKTSITLEDPATRDAAQANGKDLLAKAQDGAIRQLLFRTLAGSFIATDKHQDAARVLREGLGEFPDDVEMNNNLAFVLAVKLDRPAEAVPLAEKAANLLPANAEVQDTLGTTYERNHQLPEAVAALRRAVLLTTSPEQTVKYCIHLAEVQIAAGNKKEARDAFLNAKKTVEVNPGSVSDAAKSQLDALRKKVDAQ